MVAFLRQKLLHSPTEGTLTALLGDEAPNSNPPISSLTPSPGADMLAAFILAKEVNL